MFARRAPAMLLLTMLVSIALFALASRAPAEAQTPGTIGYLGVTTDFAGISLTLVNDGRALSAIAFSEPNASFTNPCFEAGTASFADPVEIINGSISPSLGNGRVVNDPLTGESRVLRARGTFGAVGTPQEGIVIGAVSVGPVGPNPEGISCNPRSFGFAAVARTRAEQQFPAAPYRGAVIAGESFDGLREAVGTVRFTVTDDGNAITGISMTFAQDCTSFDLGAAVVSLTDGAVSFSQEGKVSTAIPTVARISIAIVGGRAVGAFYIDRNAAGCRPLAGTFVATATRVPGAPLVPVTPTPTPEETKGNITSGDIPPEGIGLIVWGGGTNAQLLDASGCPEATAIFWTLNAAGGFDSWVPRAPSVVNAAWTSRFPNGIPQGTVLLGRCKEPDFNR